MSTLTKEKGSIVDFTGIDKIPDWRYNTWETIKFKDHAQKSIHWIGVVSLSEFDKTARSCFLYFRNWQNKLTLDQKQVRDVDGAATGSSVAIEYYLDQQLIDALVQARSEGAQYFNFFIKETVGGHGYHYVYILYREKFPAVLRYGIPTQQPWFQEHSPEWSSRTQVMIPEEIEEKLILREGHYNWLK